MSGIAVDAPESITEHSLASFQHQRDSSWPFSGSANLPQTQPSKPQPHCGVWCGFFSAFPSLRTHRLAFAGKETVPKLRGLSKDAFTRLSAKWFQPGLDSFKHLRSTARFSVCWLVEVILSRGDWPPILSRSAEPAHVAEADSKRGRGMHKPLRRASWDQISGVGKDSSS